MVVANCITDGRNRGFRLHDLEHLEEEPHAMNPPPIVRLMLYALVAMGTAAGAGVINVDLSDMRQATAFLMSVIVAGGNAAISYFDKSNEKKP